MEIREDSSRSALTWAPLAQGMISGFWDQVPGQAPGATRSLPLPLLVFSFSLFLSQMTNKTVKQTNKQKELLLLYREVTVQ